MKKTINFCGNCPFMYSDYDDFSVGDSTADMCTLALFLGQDGCISTHNGDSEEKTPDWCPLKKEEYTFNFNEFSANRLEQMEKTKKEIKELEKHFEKYSDIDDIENNNKLTSLYNQFSELQSNEEQLFGKKFQEDINKGMSEIEKQLEQLKNVGEQLEKTFNKLGDE